MNINILTFKDPICYLSAVLNFKSIQNQKYSLRAFSRDLNIPLSMLSSMLSEKRPISYQYANKIANRLKFSSIEFQYFFDLITVKYGNDTEIKENSKLRIERLLKTLNDNQYDHSYSGLDLTYE